MRINARPGDQSQHFPWWLRSSGLEICRSSQGHTHDKLLLPPATERPTLYAKLDSRDSKRNFRHSRTQQLLGGEVGIIQIPSVNTTQR